jgi:predicted DnaQ family exonuclease/DinG family helicase
MRPSEVLRLPSSLPDEAHAAAAQNGYPVTRTYVALDLETTGLDPERDAIMEAGAVRFRVSLDQGRPRAEVLDTWESLVNPGRPIPIQIQQLTGISQEAVNRAPRFGQVRQELARFVGSYPVIGHNVAFDLSFLNNNDLPLSNLRLDTFELASILKPHATRYSLAKLCEAFGLETGDAHRALHDALAVKKLFVALLDQAAELPMAILQEINRLADRVEWPLKEVFRDLENSQAHTAFRGSIGQQLQARRREGEDPLGPLFTTEQDEEEELVRAPQPQPLDEDALAAMLEEGGLFAQHFPGFEHRPQQVEMLRAVARAFSERKHLLVEAGTGTGKSVAYLLPAVAFAHMNGERVLVSTATINLQDQLFLKDTPDLQKLLPFEFRAALLKGRTNYLCQRRLAALRQVGTASPEEMRMLAKVLVWLPSTQTGEQGELFMPDPVEQALWGRISSDSETCTADRCRYRERGRCFFYRARRAAERAHIVIVNHALLLSDVATENRVLPEYHYLIVDEAHHLEANVTNQLSFQADQRAVERTLNDLARPLGTARSIGFLSDLLIRFRGKIPPQDWAHLDDQVHHLQRQIEAALANLHSFFSTLGAFLREHNPQQSDYDRRLRLTSGLRVQPAWTGVEIAWEDLSARLLPLVDELDGLRAFLGDMDDDSDEIEGLAQECAGYGMRLRETHDQINACISQPVPTAIYWATLSARDERLTLHAAPLHVGSLVEKHLFHAKEVVILTSATLTTDASFDFLRGRLAAWDADELAVGSPFDFKSSALLCLPTDIPEPNEAYYQKTVEQTLLALCRASQGRALVLFTSYSQLQNTARAITRPLADNGIVLYQQGSGVSRVQLLENFRTTPRSILLGTRSFWEGIDVVGPALSVLVISRLPFSVPDDPIFAARAETFDNPFAEYAIPEAILRFRQGFGRLIRTKTDRGVVVVLDKRLLTKSYGSLFLNSLPDCTVAKLPLASLPEAARQWLTSPNP